MQRAVFLGVAAVSLVAVAIASNQYRAGALLTKNDRTPLVDPADAPPAKSVASATLAEGRSPTSTESAETSARSGTEGKKSTTAQKPQKTATAVFAGGCFWCTEAAFEQLKGVVDVKSGYAGGSKETANYHRVSGGDTGHAEAIRVTYDPTRISYERLLDVFFDAHDPTELNRQGNDVGTQYRSAIFFANKAEEQAAQTKIKKLTAARVFPHRIATSLEPLVEFYPAEDYHQDYARLHPANPYIRHHSYPKVCRVRDKHPELINKSDD